MEEPTKTLSETSTSDAPASHERPIPDLTSLLAETTTLVDQHEVQLNEVDRKIAELREAMAKFDLWKNNRVKRLETFKKIENPYAKVALAEALTEEEKKTLVKLGLMDTETGKQLTELGRLIDKLESLKNPTPEISNQLLKLLEAESLILGKLKESVNDGGIKFEERRNRIREKTLNVYNARTGRYGQIIKTLQADPLVQQKLEQEELLTSFSKNVQSALSRQRLALDNVAKTMGVDSVEETLKHVLELDGNEQRMLVYNLRADLVEAIKSGAIKSPADIVPWRTKTGAKYSAIMRNVKDEKNKEMLEGIANDGLVAQQRHSVGVDEALRIIYGREFDGMGKDRNGKPVKKQKSQFWQAFDNEGKQ